mmetsp:Transcript_56294/g.115129  ORF Transcript_56294/g.115129 Transcript_56294/m.115129 type:complete len:239 (-) Transcript_56294:16-732(-)
MPSVPEGVMKKRATAAKVDGYRAAAATKRAADDKKRQEEAFKRAEKYLNEAKSAEGDLLRLKREAKAAGDAYVEPEARVAIVVRIRGIIGVGPKQRKILQLLRLRQINNAVFVKLNKATVNMLRLVEPYIAYGYPSLKTVKNLVYKRGFGKINRQRIPLSDNAIVDKALGRHDLVCVEDVIHEIATVGPHFKEASNFLWPFKLSNPVGGLKRKLFHFNEGGQAGNRGVAIDALIAKML